MSKTKRIKTIISEKLRSLWNVFEKAPADKKDSGPSVPKVEEYLGKDYGPKLVWDHPDDLFIDFNVVPRMVVYEPRFMMRYVSSELRDDERGLYPYKHTPCHVEIGEAVGLNMIHPWNQINDYQYGTFVSYHNVLGVLIAATSDFEHVRRLSLGLTSDELEGKLYIQLQFMQFPPEVIAKIGLGHSVSELHRQSSTNIRINFAKFIED